MGEVDKHSLALHPLYDVSSERCQTTLRHTVRRATDLIVEEVCRRHHPKAGIKKRIHVFEPAIESMGPFYAEDPADNSLFSLAPFEKPLEISGGPDDCKLTARAGCHLVQAPGLIDCTFLETS